ncbi:hypothetical protein BGZ94_010136 [Podila epigama]|nr:hypothetical protein BGZ94_010136 [Podila epigama]
MYSTECIVQRAHVMQHRDGRSKGHGLVLFDKTEEATKAQEMFNGHVWHGRTLEVREDRSIVDYAVKKSTPDRREVVDADALAGEIGANLTITAESKSTEDVDVAANTEREESGPGEEPSQHRPNSVNTPVSNGKTVYVANIPFRVKWQDLKDFFRGAGNVIRADVAMSLDKRSRGFGSVIFATEEEAKKAIGFCGYKKANPALNPDLEIALEESMLTRMAFIKETVKDHPILYAQVDDASHLLRVSLIARVNNRISPTSLQRNGPPMNQGFPGRQVFVGNLPFQCTWQDLKNLFRKAGHILRADVVTNSEGQSRGFGSVLFTTVEDAQTAINMFDNYELNGRNIRVHFDRYAPMAHAFTNEPEFPPTESNTPNGNGNGNIAPPELSAFSSPPSTFESSPGKTLGSASPKTPPAPASATASATVVAASESQGNETGSTPQDESPNLPQYPFHVNLGPVGKPNVGPGHPQLCGPVPVPVPIPVPVLLPGSAPMPVPLRAPLSDQVNALPTSLEPSALPLSAMDVPTSVEFVPRNLQEQQQQQQPQHLHAQPYPFCIGATEVVMSHDLGGNDESNMISPPPFYMYPTLPPPQKPFQHQGLGYTHYQDQYAPDPLRVGHSYGGPMVVGPLIGGGNGGSTQSHGYHSQPEWIAHPSMFSMGPPQHMYSTQPLETSGPLKGHD